ncbi:MAG: hypothetical protein ACTS3F_14845 [Phycisphaerales bacterium]
MQSGLSTLLSRALRRWVLARFVMLSVAWLTVAAGMALFVRIGERLLPFSVDWGLVAPLMAGGALVAAGAHAWVTRPARDRLARILDERSALRETLSTALAVAARPDPWSRAAVAHAEESSHRVVLRDNIPVRAPGWWYVPALLALACAGLGFTPRTNLLDRLASASSEDEGVEGNQAAIIEARADVERSTEELRKAMSAVESPDLQQALEDLLAPDQDMTDPSDIRRDALKKMTELQERLESLANDEKGESLDQLSERLKKIDERGMPDLKPLLDALKDSRFGEANQEMKELSERASDPNLTQEERDALAEQLQKLAEQLEQQSEQAQREMEEQLKEAGVDPKLANNPEGLREALEQAGMDEQQIQQMLEQAAQNQQLQQMLEKMAGQCQNCAGGMKQGGEGGKNMQGLADQLKEMQTTQEQRDAAMQALQAIAESRGSLGECMGGDGEAMGLIPPKFTKQGGRGAGSSWARNDGGSEVDESKYEVSDRLRAESPQGEGPIISSTLVFGDQLIGESKQVFREAVEQASQAATESVSNTRVPREYHEVIRRYFGELERTGGDSPGAAPSPAPSDPASPAAP